MPKHRYKIMAAYMPRVGSMGLDMMFRSCTIQVNLDFDSEADMVTKFRVGLALQPIATALFANSPFKDGQPTGFKSYRSHVWTDVDGDRCGILPFVFEPGFGFERYADYALDVPMYFVHGAGGYADATQTRSTFREFIDGRSPAAGPGRRPTLADWETHLTTIFPEVRLKRYIEMRGADGGPWTEICALPALWVGLLYDPASLTDAKIELLAGTNMVDYAADVWRAKAGFAAKLYNISTDNHSLNRAQVQEHCLTMAREFEMRAGPVVSNLYRDDVP
jgi:glutamate--cysteine ligase